MLIKGRHNMEISYTKYVFCEVYKMMKVFLSIKCTKVKILHFKNCVLHFIFLYSIIKWKEKQIFLHLHKVKGFILTSIQCMKP